MSRLTKAERKELARRYERTRREGGISLDDIRADMLEDMIAGLSKMVCDYTGTARQTHELLKAIVVAETEGVTTEALSTVLEELRVKLKRSAMGATAATSRRP